MKLRDLGLVLVIMVIWGLNYPIGKIGVGAVPPMMMITVRFVVVAVMLIPFVPVPWGHMRRIFYLSFMIGVLHFAPNFTGLKLVDSGVGAILNQLSVPFSALLAAIFFNDRLGWRRLLGMALAFAGVGVLVGEPKRGTDLFGAFLMMAAALAWAISLVQTKFLKQVHPLALVGWMTLMAVPQLFVLSLLLEDAPITAALAMGWNGWGPIFYMAICVSIVSHSLWYSLIHRYPINVTAPFALLTPVFGVFFGIVILHEELTWLMLVGSVLTLIGVGIITIRRPAQAEPLPER
ncbi:MAG: EamA family transporter [Rhodospirillaceae bacterium]|nr:EamA family transporter [Rhodospirillaceae bacterium]